MGALAAGIGAAGSILGGITSGKGAKKAAQVQAAAYQKGIDEQNREFGVVQANNQPYMQAGNSGLQAYLGLIGLGGGGAGQQQTAINSLEASPMYTSQYNSGLNAILQNSAATGGLRGGNAALAQSDFGAQLLSQVIQNQLGNYGGLISTGQAAASGTNSAALSTGNNISNLLGQQGGANAAAAAAPYAAATGIINGVTGAAGQYFGGGGTSSGVGNGFGWGGWTSAGSGPGYGGGQMTLPSW